MNAPQSTALPTLIAINLQREDADAWDRASKPSGLLILAFGVAALERAANLPLDAQPEIYEMPTGPGANWPGDRRPLTIDAPLGTSIVRIATELGVSVHDWAYSVIIAASLKFRKSEVTSPKKFHHATPPRGVDHTSYPSSPGFYWWRPHGMDAWQVLEVRSDRKRAGALYVRQDSEDVYQAEDDPEHPWFGQWFQTPLIPPSDNTANSQRARREGSPYD